MFNLPDEVVIFDLEWTSWQYSMGFKFRRPGEHREIVQIGAVRTETKTGKFPLLEKFECMVMPSINPKLSKYFIELSGITQEQIDGKGEFFPEAIKKFWDFSGLYPCWSWEKDDAVVIGENCQIHDLPCPFFGPESFFDLRDIFWPLGIKAENYNSGNLTEIFGQKSKHRRHQGIDDTLTIIDALRMLAEGKKLTSQAKK